MGMGMGMGVDVGMGGPGEGSGPQRQAREATQKKGTREHPTRSRPELATSGAAAQRREGRREVGHSAVAGAHGHVLPVAHGQQQDRDGRLQDWRHEALVPVRVQPVASHRRRASFERVRGHLGWWVGGWVWGATQHQCTRSFRGATHESGMERHPPLPPPPPPPPPLNPWSTHTATLTRTHAHTRTHTHEPRGLPHGKMG